MHSTIIFPGCRVSDFVGNSFARKLNKAQTKRVNIIGAQHNSRGSIGSGVNFVVSFLFYFLFLLIPTFCRCCRGPALKYPVRYGRSRHRHRFRYLASDTPDGTLLRRPLLREKCSRSHRSRRRRSAELGRRQHFPTRYARARPPASVPPPRSSPRVSIAVHLVVLLGRCDAARDTEGGG